MATFEITRVGSLDIDDIVVEVDDDSLTTDEEVNANYSADDALKGGWASRVTALPRHHVDITDVTLSTFGEEKTYHQVSTDAFIWRIK